MVTQVQLGNFFTTSSGQTILGGAGGSGLNTQAIIQELLTVKSQPATQDQTEITKNNTLASALGQFQSLLDTFQSAAQVLSNPPGVGSDVNNVFDFTTGSVTSNGSGYVSVTTQPGAAQQSYTINNITSLATNTTQSTETFNIASADTAIVVSPADATMGDNEFTAGTLNLPNGATINISAGESLNDIAAQFNSVSATSGISATVLEVSSGEYQLQFASTQTGSANSFNLKSTSIDSGNTVFGNVDLSTPAGGANAMFKINGQEITRSSNNISDVISGVTFNLQQITSTDPTTNANIGVTVSPDTTTVQNSIVAFVNAYNALKSFAATQTELNSNGTYASSAVLATNSTFNNTMNSIIEEVTAQVEGLSYGDNLTSLASLGITLTNNPATSSTPEVNNILTVNDGQLTSALATNFQDVENVFGLNLTSDSPDLTVFSANNSLSATSFTLTANPTGDSFTAQVTAPVTQSTASISVAQPITSFVTDGSTSSVTVNQTNNGLQDGDVVTISGVTNPPGTLSAADLEGTFYVSNVTANSYTITAGAADTSGTPSTGGTGTAASPDAPVVASTSTPGEFTAGTITLNGQAITLATTDTMDSIAAKFNAVEGVTGVAASVVRVDPSDYQLVFTSTEPGPNHAFDLTSTLVDPGNTVFGNVGLTTATTGNVGSPISLQATADASGGTLYFTLAAPSGSALDGLQMIYGTTSTETVHVTATQGIAQLMYNTSTSALTANTGTIAEALKQIQTNNNQLNTDITNVNTQVNQYQTQLLQQYSALEQAVSSVNTLLDSLNANENAQLEEAQQA